MGRKRNKNKYEPAAETEGEKRRREDGLSPEEGVSGEAPALTIDERRAAAGRAMARAREILDTLRAQGAPMPLTEQRLKEIEEWGEGLLQRGVDGRPTDDASKAIQQGLDEQKVSAEYVREMRREENASGIRVCPHYPYQSAEQEYVATRVDAMNLSAQQKDALFAMLHGEDGHPSLLRPDIQDAKRLLTRRALEDAEKNMPRCAVLCNLAPPLCACQVCMQAGCAAWDGRSTPSRSNRPTARSRQWRSCTRMRSPPFSTGSSTIRTTSNRTRSSLLKWRQQRLSKSSKTTATRS